MIIARNPETLRNEIKQQRLQGHRIAIVPTMGNLHAGHLALVREALQEADFVVTTIFVNPMQFGPSEDLDTYPRTLEEDQKKLEGLGNHLLFLPESGQIYPEGLASHTQVSVPGITDALCGASRPGHFTGVSTVVCILFNLVQPDLAFFGEKDFQQLAVIRKMVKDLAMPIDIRGMPTVREKNGLAMSSRNQYLSESKKEKASAIYASLQRLARDFTAHTHHIDRLLEAERHALTSAGFEVDYYEAVDSHSLQAASDSSREVTLVLAVWLDGTRLIDNLSISIPPR